ncbi:hypothetical protein, partial [Listeria sp. ILCC796]|uniref:hypothetical protein n=2 Tax=unclassified Listeria TaxID=2642072 RepID=UPI00210157D8
YQDEDKYTILTLEELNEKIMKAWQDKTYYMDGKVYSGAAGSILQASAYVEDWEGQLAESGIMSALSGVGLGAAIARGSKAYKGGSGAISPSEIAKSWQGSGKYPGVDKYKDITLKEGKIVYRGEPNGTDYFTTKSAVERSGRDATKIYEGLQVEKNPVHGYRGEMQGYKVTKNTDAAFGKTKANPQYGKGGLPQVFVPDANELIEKGILVPVDKIILKK